MTKMTDSKQGQGDSSWISHNAENTIWNDNSPIHSDLRSTQPTKEELEDDSFWEQSGPSRSAPAKMGCVASKLINDLYRKNGRELEAAGHGTTQDSSESLTGVMGHSLNLEDEALRFEPDMLANNRLRGPVPPSDVYVHFMRLKSTENAILPAYRRSTASLYYMAPAHVDDSHQFCWTLLFRAIDRLEAYQKLEKNVHSSFLLTKNGYRLDTYKKLSDLDRLQNCRKCLRLKKNIKGDKVCRYHREKDFVEDSDGNKVFSCCGKIECCEIHENHEWQEPVPMFEDHYNSFITTPVADKANPKCKAVVIDCEMVGISYGLSEIARLAAVDYISGDVLIDCFVDPIYEVDNWRTKHSGITAKNMAKAKAKENCFSSWQAARDALLKFVDSETILVGAALQNDLAILRLVHTRNVDCAIVSQVKIGGPWNRVWGLKTLCKEMLGLEIQASEKGHNPVEDCFATREVVLWMTVLEKGKFGQWAAIKRLEEEKRFLEEKRKAEERREKELEEERNRDGTYEEQLAEAYGIDPSMFAADKADGETDSNWMQNPSTGDW